MARIDSSNGVSPLLIALGLWLAACNALGEAPGQPQIAQEEPDPRTIVSFGELYSTNCAGCHGARGKGGPAIGLSSPGYLAIAPDEAIAHVVAEGRPGTTMPAFAESAGGMLKDAQVAALVAGIRAWAPSGQKPTGDAPPYASTESGDWQRGGHVFGQRCAACHGVDGKGKQGIGSIVEGSFLELVSEQALRTHILAGRADLGCPDFRANGATPMSSVDVSDTVAWLSSHRQPLSGQPNRLAQREMRKP
ncbi:MAG: c-type cytochrome [Pseudomonadota bacterium]